MTRRPRTALGHAPGRARAAGVLAAMAAVLALLVIGIGFALAGIWSSSPEPSTSNGAGPGVVGRDPMLRAELELITRPMPPIPDQAALPHALADDDPGEPLVLPAPAVVSGHLVPGGFPATPEGALAQLVALTRAGIAGGDPGSYDAAYDAVAQPGAPSGSSSYVHRQLADLRSHGGLRPAGPVPGLAIDWTPTSGLIKGTTSGGSLVVVCVLGQLDVDYQGRVASAGLGDCQAMRRAGGAWRIAAGPPAATAPSAWPGSSEAAAAGYRELR